MVKYEDYYSEEDVATFQRLKRGQMNLARIARGVAAEIVGGRILRTGKEFVHTPCGMFRLAMRKNSDNTTEVTRHIEMGAITINMGNPVSLRRFFRLHGLSSRQAMIKFNREVERRMVNV